MSYQAYSISARTYEKKVYAILQGEIAQKWLNTGAGTDVNLGRVFDGLSEEFHPDIDAYLQKNFGKTKEEFLANFEAIANKITEISGSIFLTTDLSLKEEVKQSIGVGIYENLLEQPPFCNSDNAEEMLATEIVKAYVILQLELLFIKAVSRFPETAAIDDEEMSGLPLVTEFNQRKDEYLNDFMLVISFNSKDDLQPAQFENLTDTASGQAGTFLTKVYHLLHHLEKTLRTEVDAFAQLDPKVVSTLQPLFDKAQVKLLLLKQTIIEQDSTHILGAIKAVTSQIDLIVDASAKFFNGKEEKMRARLTSVVEKWAGKENIAQMSGIFTELQEKAKEAQAFFMRGFKLLQKKINGQQARPVEESRASISHQK